MSDEKKVKESTLNDKVLSAVDPNKAIPRGPRGQWLPGHSPRSPGPPKRLTRMADEWFRETAGPDGRDRARAILEEIYARAMGYVGEDGKPVPGDNKLLVWLGDRITPALKQREIEVEGEGGGTIVLKRDEGGNYRIPGGQVVDLLGKPPWMQDQQDQDETKGDDDEWQERQDLSPRSSND